MTSAARSSSPLAAYDRIIIGIDPGTNVMGYGILGVAARKPVMIAMGVIELSKFESHYRRLGRIYERVLGLVEQYLPDEMAIEAPFFGKTCRACSSSAGRRGWPWQPHCAATYPSWSTSRVKSKWPSPAMVPPPRSRCVKCFAAYSTFLRNRSSRSLTAPMPSVRHCAISMKAPSLPRPAPHANLGKSSFSVTLIKLNKSLYQS